MSSNEVARSPVGFKRRNMPLQVLWTILTLGGYTFYWYYSTMQELAQAAGRTEEPITIWTVLLFIPPSNLVSFYKQGELYEIFTKGIVSRWIIFLLWLVFAPAVWFVIQMRLNEAADVAMSAKQQPN